VRINDSEFRDLRNTICPTTEQLPEARWSSLNGTSVDSKAGRSFWYFGPSPPDETILQQVTSLAIDAKAIIIS
jgi:hypothetical protein